TLQPSVLRWARERAGISPEELARKIQVKPERVVEWEKSGRISIAQTDNLARSTHTPLGFLYLTEPPTDQLSIPDFRTRRQSGEPPSPDLLETVESMQRRQSWMRDELIAEGAEPLDFIGAWRADDAPQEVARAMRDAFRFGDHKASGKFAWASTLRRLRDQAEHAGVLVVVNSVVGNNTHRRLDPMEFQGFALVDEYAPLVFVNGADFKAAQMFTLAHELAHLLVGETGVSLLQDFTPPNHATEQFCSQTAAEFLVPESELQHFWPTIEKEPDPYQAIAQRFKVSLLVAAHRTLDLDLIDRNAFADFYQKYRDQRWHKEKNSEQSGGNFWMTQRWRVGARFGSAVARAVRENRLPYREAYNLTGLRRDTFERMLEKMEVLL
ncbi:MAG: XRE family transcriptional regulator, partial [Chloroflexota bacterium]|nr:XRE family transcriptional regulator [Chloroflexota bacterium]